MLKKSTMELGGSDALIALADADLDKTVAWALWGRMNNGGQCCMASKRIIVAEEIADEFLEKFGQLWGGCPPGIRWTRPPRSADVLAGGRRQARAQIAAVEQARRPSRSGSPCPDRRVRPANDPHRPHAGEPRLPPGAVRPRGDVLPRRGRGRGGAIANDSNYGLGGSVFTRTSTTVEVAKRIETGMVFVNHPTWTKADLPFGGVKNSGYGHELPHRHPGVHQQEAHQRRPDRRPVIIAQVE